jgi:hypothetical protein
MNFLTLKCVCWKKLWVLDTVLYKTFDDAKPDRYRLGYSLFGGSGDDSQGAAEFNVSQFC